MGHTVLHMRRPFRAATRPTVNSVAMAMKNASHDAIKTGSDACKGAVWVKYQREEYQPHYGTSCNEYKYGITGLVAWCGIMEAVAYASVARQTCQPDEYILQSSHWAHGGAVNAPEKKGYA